VPESVEFPSIGVGKLVKVRELRRGLSAQFAKNSKPMLLPNWVTALQVGTLQRTKTWGPSAFLWEGWSRCAHHRGQVSVWEPCRRQDSSDLLRPPGGAKQVYTGPGNSSQCGALQSAEMCDPLPSPRMICVGAYHRSLQSLAHTKVKTVYP